MVRHTLDVMGTVFSFDIRDQDVPPGALATAAADLHWVDRTFSTYRPDSEISRLSRGELRIDGCVPEVAEVLDLCAVYSRQTDGYFSATPGGTLDPSGLVKGWSIARAVQLLKAAGLTRFAVNGGGDVQTVGAPTSGSAWRLGVADPLQPGRLATVVTGTDIAVATSGIAERGSHIIDPFTNQPATSLASVTIVGPDIVTADVYATAAIAMGTTAYHWLSGLDSHAAFVIDADGRQWATTSFIRYDGRGG